LVSVADQGIGIPPDKLDKLFQIKHSFSTIGTSGEKGTGLGLLIVWDFIEKNHGKIWVESKVGEGTTFYFTIPIKQPTN
jgi:Signal transduction histidine kinase